MTVITINASLSLALKVTTVNCILSSMPAPLQEAPILNAALNVLTERGYTGATTKLIAEAAGVGEVTLFRKFGSKDALLLTAMQREVAKLAEEMVHYTGDVEADLLRIVSAYQTLLEARAPLMLTYVTEVSRHPELKGVLEFPYKIAQALSEMLERYQNEGKLKREDPTGQLAALLGPLLMRSVFSTVGLHGGAVDSATHVRHFLSGRAAP